MASAARLSYLYSTRRFVRPAILLLAVVPRPLLLLDGHRRLARLALLVVIGGSRTGWVDINVGETTKDDEEGREGERR